MNIRIGLIKGILCRSDLIPHSLSLMCLGISCVMTSVGLCASPYPAGNTLTCYYEF